MNNFNSRLREILKQTMKVSENKSINLDDFFDWVKNISDEDLKVAKKWLTAIQAGEETEFDMVSEFLLAAISGKLHEKDPDLITLAGELFANPKIKMDRENLVDGMGKEQKDMAPYLAHILDYWVEQAKKGAPVGWEQTKTVEALGEMGDRSAVPSLIRALKDVTEPESMFREYCIKSIKKLGALEEARVIIEKLLEEEMEKQVKDESLIEEYKKTLKS